MFTEWTLSARERRGGCGVLWKAWESWTLKAEPVLTIRMALSCTEERSKSFRKDSTLCNSSSWHRQAPVVILDRGRPSVRRDTSVKLRKWFGMSSKPYGHRFVALFQKEIFQLKMDKKPCRKNSVLFLIPHIGLVVNVQLVVPVVTQTDPGVLPLFHIFQQPNGLRRSLG